MPSYALISEDPAEFAGVGEPLAIIEEKEEMEAPINQKGFRRIGLGMGFGDLSRSVTVFISGSVTRNLFQVQTTIALNPKAFC